MPQWIKRRGAKKLDVDRGVDSPSDRDPVQQMQQPPNQDQYGICIIHEPQDATVDIILVHGLTGNRETTWTYVVRRGQTTFWPEFLTEDVPNARIATFGYDADIASPRPFEMVSTNTVHRHAVNLCNDLGRVRTGEKMKRPIIFIAHSLGGLVCKDAILYSKDSPQDHLKNISECTRAMAFLGTPHRGSNKANLGHLLARLAKLMKQTNTNIVGVLKPDSEVLNTMQEKFYHMLENRRNAGKKIDITCFYEELDDKKFGEIVPHDSATMLNYTSIGIHTDHSGLTKFQNADNEGYKKLLGEIKRWVEALENDDADDADDELNANDQILNAARPIYTYTTGASHAIHKGNVSPGAIVNYGNQNISGRAQIGGTINNHGS